MEEETFYTGLPQHIAVNPRGTEAWAQQEGASLDEADAKRFEAINRIIEAHTNLKIPILTFYVMPSESLKKYNADFLISSLAEYLDNLSSSELVHERGIKVSVIGRWYDLPGSLIESIKKIIESTQDYDKFFVNFCINYDGQDELVDACRLIARKIKAGKFDPEAIMKETIKEESYNSYFPPPDLIIKTGALHRTDGLLLWDSCNSIIFFSKKLWPEFTKEDFVEAVAFYQKQVSNV